MRLDSAHLDHARKVADAILYEGYLLYPYHRSSQKNQLRFQFGVLMPPAYGAIDACEPSASQTECLLECPDDAEVRILLRFLQLQRRTVYGVSPDTGELHKIDTLYVDGSEFTEWYEAAEREQHATATMAALLGEDKNIEFHIGAGESAEELTDSLGRKAGRLVRRWSAIDGVITIHAERADGTDLLLSSPVILYDHPEIAAESACDLFDATEIDEILTLRTLALTDSEKRQARATDPLAAELIDRLDGLPPEMLERMHGAIRYLRPAGGPAARQPAGGPGSSRHAADQVPTLTTPPTLPAGEPSAEITGRPPVPWWDPGADSSVSPETDHVIVTGVRIARGSRVLMRPGARRADAQDLFLAGREATVQAVLYDVDGQVHLAVSPDDDPAAELQRNHGRFLYFSPDEVEPIEPAGSVGTSAEQDRTMTGHRPEEEQR